MVIQIEDMLTSNSLEAKKSEDKLSNYFGYIIRKIIKRERLEKFSSKEQSDFIESRVRNCFLCTYFNCKKRKGCYLERNGSYLCEVIEKIKYINKMFEPVLEELNKKIKKRKS